jgi:hypothetical protein
VWWLSSRVRAEREHCCDDLAVEVCGDRVAYASALAELAERDAAPRLALAATDGSLLTRVARLLGRPAAGPPAPSAPFALLLVGVIAAVAFSSPVLVSAWPGLVGGSKDPPLRGANIEAARGDSDARAEVHATFPDGVDDTSPHVPSAIAIAAPVETVASAALVAQPRHPSAPVAPEVPDAPDAPDAPGAPAAPEVPDAPDAPDAPVVPDAPKAPDQSGNFSWSDNGDHLHAEWTGNFTLADDDRDIVWIEEGGRVILTEGRVFKTRVELRGVPGGRIERHYYRSGFERPYEPEGREWLATTLAILVQRSGLFAEQRVARLLNDGGAEAVLSAIDRLPANGGYVRRRYYEELLDQAPHTADLLSRIVERAGRATFSDYERARVLKRVTESKAVLDAHRVQVAAASRAIGSDYEQRRVLITAMPERLSEPLASAILAAAAELNSDYERSTLLATLAERGGVTIDTSERYLALAGQLRSGYEQRRALAKLAQARAAEEAVALRAVKTAAAIQSEYDRRQVVAAFLERSAMTLKLADAALMSADTLRSSHERSVVLLELVARGGLTAETAETFFRVVSGLGSSYEHRRVLEAAIDRSLSEPLVIALIRNAGSISSDYERATVLVRVAEKHDLSSEARTVYIDIAETIRSEHEQTRTLAALVKAERRRRVQ